MSEMKWLVEFNECGTVKEERDSQGNILTEFKIPSYEGQELTKGLLETIAELDEKVHRLAQTGEAVGYWKFYFDKVVDGEVVSHARFDIGDGQNVNAPYFAEIAKEVA